MKRHGVVSVLQTSKGSGVLRESNSSHTADWEAWKTLEGGLSLLDRHGALAIWQIHHDEAIGVRLGVTLGFELSRLKAGQAVTVCWRPPRLPRLVSTKL